MKVFLRRKAKSLIALAASLAVLGAGLILAFTYFNVNSNGVTLVFAAESGEAETLEAVSPTYDGSGFFLTSYYGTGDGRRSVVRKIGENNEVIFENVLEHATVNGVSDKGIFSYVTGVSENRVIAFTSNFYYLYELKNDGLTFLDAYQGNLNIGAGAATGVKNFAFDVYGDAIDIYTLDNKGASAASLRVFVEKTTIKNDRFTGSVYGEIKKTSGKRLTNMGAQGKGIAVTEDHGKVIAVFTSAKAVMFSSDLSGLDAHDVAEYNEKVKTIQVGEGVEGNTVTAAQYDGKNALYACFQNRKIFRLSEKDFTSYDTEEYEPDFVAALGEYGSFCSFDVSGKTLFVVNEDGNTLYAVDTERNGLDYSVSLKFKIKNMVSAPLADVFVCQWKDSITDKIRFTVYDYTELSRMDVAVTGKAVCLAAGIFAFAASVFSFFTIFSEKFSGKSLAKVKSFFKKVWKFKLVYLLILPSFSLLFMFSIYPSVSAIINSFFEYELGKPKVFVGLANYEELFVTNRGLLIEIGRNTLLLVGTYLFTHVVPPVFYAYIIMLLRNKNSVKVIRWFMYIPGLLPTIAAMLMWRYGIYGINPDGALNVIIKTLGGTPIPFLGHSDYAIWSILFIGFPWVGGFLLFYGALLTVPTEVYDACELDGCGLIKRFFVIDLPFIMGQIKYVSIGAFIAGVKSVGRIMATTGGQMGTMTLMYKLYEYLNKNQYGMASTIAVIMVILLAGISLARVRKMLRKESSYD